MPYRAPLADYDLLLSQVLGLDRIAATPRFAEATPETARAVLAEAGRLCETTLAPLNRIGDKIGARLENGIVRTPPGFAEAYRAMALAAGSAWPPGRKTAAWACPSRWPPR